MYAVAFGVIAFIVAQSMFFIIKSWKHGRELGISRETLTNTVTSSIMFTIAPAISILVTVFVLAKALGVILPWIRLTVIGNLAYETVAAETALNNLGGSLSNEITDMKQFSTVVWAMTIGSVFPLTFLPIVCKKLQKKIQNFFNKGFAAFERGSLDMAIDLLYQITTVLRQQEKATSAYGIAFVVVTAASFALVNIMGFQGAVWAYFVVMVVLLVLLVIQYVRARLNPKRY